jgi:ArsR family transcriptional regulator, arsenate/arsenite/antimonite-responsive transcriptional repressor
MSMYELLVTAGRRHRPPLPTAATTGRTPVPRPSPIAIAEAACCGPLSVTLDEDRAVELAQLFAALADPVRLRLLSMVAAQGEVCSCELQGPLGKSQPTVSHHTKALADAGLIVGEKRGRWVWWRVVPERLAALREALQ